MEHFLCPNRERLRYIIRPRLRRSNLIIIFTYLSCLAYSFRHRPFLLPSCHVLLNIHSCPSLPRLILALSLLFPSLLSCPRPTSSSCLHLYIYLAKAMDPYRLNQNSTDSAQETARTRIFSYSLLKCMKLDYIDVREDIYAEHSGDLPVSPTRP